MYTETNNNVFAYAMSRLEDKVKTITLEAQKAELISKIARLRAEMYVERISRKIEQNSKIPAIVNLRP
jgi:hypothetical protein